jgi:hypothetical protein
MKKIVKITEQDLARIVKKTIEEQEMEEGLFDGVKDAYQGLKGVWRGEGYDYYKYTSSLRNIAKKLKKLDEPNHKTMIELNSLKSKVGASKMDQTKKQNLVDTIDKAIQYFNAYAGLIDKIDQIASTKLS